jgi:hypothetical protein
MLCVPALARDGIISLWKAKCQILLELSSTKSLQTSERMRHIVTIIMTPITCSDASTLNCVMGNGSGQYCMLKYKGNGHFQLLTERKSMNHANSKWHGHQPGQSSSGSTWGRVSSYGVKLSTGNLSPFFSNARTTQTRRSTPTQFILNDVVWLKKVSVLCTLQPPWS